MEIKKTCLNFKTADKRLQQLPCNPVFVILVRYGGGARRMERRDCVFFSPCIFFALCLKPTDFRQFRLIQPHCLQTIQHQPWRIRIFCWVWKVECGQSNWPLVSPDRVQILESQAPGPSKWPPRCLACDVSSHPIGNTSHLRTPDERETYIWFVVLPCALKGCLHSHVGFTHSLSAVLFCARPKTTARSLREANARNGSKRPGFFGGE